jgi:MOSC domain-containing protein YiiM
MTTATFPTMLDLEAALPYIRQSPTDTGCVSLIVRRPVVDEREVLEAAELTMEAGLVGDAWATRARARAGGGEPSPDTQLTLMNSRVISLLARTPERWPLAGDQFFVDLDLSITNLPAGTRLATGSAVLEITAELHAGCAKFSARFGRDALRFVNGPVGRELRLRGVYARVVQAGTLRTGDTIARQR